MKNSLFTSILLLALLMACVSATKTINTDYIKKTPASLITGAENIDSYIKTLNSKKIGLTINNASRVGERLLLDTLIDLGVAVNAIYTPEHGLFADKSAGELISNDSIYGIPVYSLYGKTKKPELKWLDDLDLMIFDLQDVGLRFYTYISTLHYIMEACSEKAVPLLVLDRPNPFWKRVEGPVLDLDFQSFIGMHPVPVIYGMTIGEYALMIKGENWIANDHELDLNIVPILNHEGMGDYRLKVPPSPNLPNYQSILNYPSLCFFEGTSISIGRGTAFPFEVIGHPLWENTDTILAPKSCKASIDPKHKDTSCAFDFVKLSNDDEELLNLEILIESYKRSKKYGHSFVTRDAHFDKLAGSSTLRKDIERNVSVVEIRRKWAIECEEFAKIRSKYLIYKR